MDTIDPVLAASITAAVTVFVWFLTFVWSGLLKQEKPDNNILKILAFVASIVVAFFQRAVELPALPVFTGDLFAYAYGLLSFATSLIAVATAVFKAAQVIYDYIWSKLMELLDKGVGGLLGRPLNLFLPH